MLDKILVPLDGSELADRILIHVRRILVREDAEVTLLNVGREGDGSEDERSARRHVEGLRDRLNEQGARAATRFVAGDVARRILDVASEIRPSLIAMSTHGRSGLERFVRGSVAERVLSRATTPLLLANPFALGGESELRIKRILVPLDLSETSAEVIPLAAGVARLYGAELVLLHALDPRATPAEAEKLIRAQGARAGDVPTRVRLGADAAAVTILDAVEEEEADLVAMTTHGRAGLTDWAFGSTAEQVLRHCASPVLIVRKARVREPASARQPVGTRA